MNIPTPPPTPGSPTALQSRFAVRRTASVVRSWPLAALAASLSLACGAQHEAGENHASEDAALPEPGTPQYVEAVKQLKRSSTTEAEFERGLSRLAGESHEGVTPNVERELELQGVGINEVTWQSSSVYAAETYVRHIQPASGTVTITAAPSSGDTMLAVIHWKIPLANDWPAPGTQAPFDVVAFNDDYDGMGLGSQVRFEADGTSKYTVIVMPYGRSLTGSATLDISGCGACDVNVVVPVVGQVRNGARGNVFEVTGSTGAPAPDPMLFAFRVFPKASWDIEFQGHGVFNDNQLGSTLPRVHSDLRLMGNHGQDFVLTRNKSGTSSAVRLQQTHRNDVAPVIGLASRPNNPTDTGCVAPLNAAAIPETLEATKCFQLNDGKLTEAFANGVVPYEVAHPFWSDGVVKERGLALPNGTSITSTNGKWSLPAGGVMIKNFRFDGKLFETRFVAQTAGGPLAYAYRWDSNPTRATRIDNKTTDRTKVLTPDYTWDYPSQSQCLQCHHNASGNFFLGLRESQFNLDVNYAATGLVANQIRTLSSLQMLTGVDVEHPAAGFQPRPDTVGQIYSYEQARAYMDVNCSYCHNESRTSRVWKPGFERSFVDMDVCQTTANRPVESPVLEPGSPDTSTMIALASIRGGFQMPLLATKRVDTAGVELMSRWIEEMSTCGPGIVELRPMSDTQSCATVGDRTDPQELRSVDVQQCVFNEPHQSFNLVDDGGGFFSIKVTHASTDDCILYRNGSEIVHSGCGNVTKAWRKVTVPGGGFELRSSQDDDICLTTDGALMIPASCKQLPSQLWNAVSRWW